MKPIDNNMRKINYGMVGGGPGAFIGGVHRLAAAMDGQMQLVCGAFSSSPEKSKQAGIDLFLPANRVYDSYEQMILAEKQMPVGERMDVVVIVTPNHVHFGPAKMALEHGFHVVCDKPATFTTAEALELKTLVDQTGLIFALTHNYTGYPMVKQARAMVKEGRLGTIRKVVVEYPQGWLATRLEATGSKQADWRTDPARSGAAGCMGDIGTHAENLAEYITGLKIESLCADLTTFVAGRQLDDDGSVLLRFAGGAKGLLFASQISVGEENNLRIRVYGEKGGLEWFQAEPNTLLVKWLDQPIQIYRAGGNHAYLHPSALAACRIPAGHPEGYLEAFANIYRGFVEAFWKRESGQDWLGSDFPTIEDGIRGMQFIDAVVASSASVHKWTSIA
jgi:predicted dehydrogenase